MPPIRTLLPAAIRPGSVASRIFSILLIGALPVGFVACSGISGEQRNKVAALQPRIQAHDAAACAEAVYILVAAERWEEALATAEKGARIGDPRATEDQKTCNNMVANVLSRWAWAIYWDQPADAQELMKRSIEVERRLGWDTGISQHRLGLIEQRLADAGPNPVSPVVSGMIAGMNNSLPAVTAALESRQATQHAATASRRALPDYAGSGTSGGVAPSRPVATRGAQPTVAPAPVSGGPGMRRFYEDAAKRMRAEAQQYPAGSRQRQQYLDSAAENERMARDLDSSKPTIR